MIEYVWYGKVIMGGTTVASVDDLSSSRCMQVEWYKSITILVDNEYSQSHGSGHKWLCIYTYTVWVHGGYIDIMLLSVWTWPKYMNVYLQPGVSLMKKSQSFNKTPEQSCKNQEKSTVLYPQPHFLVESKCS